MICYEAVQASCSYWAGIHAMVRSNGRWVTRASPTDNQDVISNVEQTGIFVAPYQLRTHGQHMHQAIR